MPKGYSHLTKNQRIQIEALLFAGFNMRSIAKTLNKSHSTISREKRRNGIDGYFAESADELAVLRRKNASSKSKKMSPQITNLILEMLQSTQASPEQISGRLAREYSLKISHESIYRYILQDKKDGGNLFKHLRHQGKKYNNRFGKTAGRGLIPHRVGIEKRPEIVMQKQRFGDLEVDTIVGKNHQGKVLSIVDRATKYAFFARLENGGAQAVAMKMCELLAAFSAQNLLKTITSDNGKEFAAHLQVSRKLRLEGFFFANPYASWERGLNEHTNKLFRQYYPKGTDFTTISEADVQKVANRINHRPRKVLNYATPFEAMHGLLFPTSSCALRC